MRARHVLVRFGILLAFTTICIRAYAADTFAVSTQLNIETKMRDGTVLRADIYRPQAEGTFPVLLQRTPYDKRNERGFGVKAASRGYLVVVQDVRGRYSSDGDWYPFKNESNDGYDTVEWVASLPHSNGKVGMFGGSYVGATQMLTAISHPPHLSAICPVVTASNYHDGWTYQSGAFEQWFNQIVDVWSCARHVRPLDPSKHKPDRHDMEDTSRRLSARELAEHDGHGKPASHAGALFQ